MNPKCLKCGEPFEREKNESWKKLCFPCWISAKNSSKVAEVEKENFRLSKENENLKRKLSIKNNLKISSSEFEEHFPFLIRSVHPDRNDGSRESHNATIWLLELRKEIKNG